MIKVNLAPPVARPRVVRLPPPGIGLGIAGLALVTGFAGAAWTAGQDESRLAQSVARSSDEMVALRSALGREAHGREHLADLVKRTRTLQELARRQDTSLRILDALADVVPRNLRLTTLEGHGLELRAHGSALSATAVADLMSGLRASGKFVNVDIVVSRRDLTDPEDAPVIFEVTCRLRD